MAKRNAHTVIKAYVHTYVHIHICSMYIKKSKTASGIVFIYLPLPTDDVEQISQTVPASAAAIRYICMYVISGGGGGGSELDTHLIVRHLRYFIF